MINEMYSPYNYAAPEKEEGDNGRYIFISYAHTDSVRVTRVLNILHRHGLRMWNDKGIELSTKWYKSIMDAIEHSSAFLCFLSQGAEMRSVIIDEINTAMAMREKRGADDYNIVFVNLDHVSPSLFRDERIQKLLTSSQCLNLYDEDITESSMLRLINTLWKTKAVRQGCAQPFSSEELEFFHYDNNGYIYERGNYNESLDDVRKCGFRKLTHANIDPYMAYPTCMDNQWVPPEFVNDKSYMENGPSVFKEDLTKYQHRELCRALIHNWQILINRAFMFNGSLFMEYIGSDTERQALRSLMCSGSIVMFLYSEKGPFAQNSFSNDEKKRGLWDSFAESISSGGNDFFYCFRFDWDDDINKYEINKIGRGFETFCINTANNGYLLDQLMSLFRISEQRDKDAFRQQWQVIQRAFIEWQQMPSPKPQGREFFYQKFVIEPGTPVPDGRLMRGKTVFHVPAEKGGVMQAAFNFAPQLKQIIDYVYSTNLPRALGIQALIPAGTLTFPLSETEEGRMVKIDELKYSVSEFKFSYDKDIYTVRDENITLDHVARIRKHDSWLKYMMALTEGRKRSHINELDFYDISSAYQRYHELIEDLYRQFYDELEKKGKLDELDKYITPCEPVLTIIYRMGTAHITTEYRGGMITVKNAEAGGLKGDGSEAKRRVHFSVCYICGSNDDAAESSCLLTEICLFDGITYENGSTFYNSLLAHLKLLNSQQQKEESAEWKSFNELISDNGKRNRLKEYVSERFSASCHIESRLISVCGYEQLHPNTVIGVSGDELCVLLVRNTESFTEKINLSELEVK